MLSPEGIRDPTGNLGAPKRIKGYLPSEIIGKQLLRSSMWRRIGCGAIRKVALEDRIARGPLREGRAGVCARTAPVFLSHVIIDPIRTEDGETAGLLQKNHPPTSPNCRKAEDRKYATSLGGKAAVKALVSVARKMDALGSRLTGGHGACHDFNKPLNRGPGQLGTAAQRFAETIRHNDGDCSTNAVSSARKEARR